MKKFSENFYTDDFDQEMLDFIEENYNILDKGGFLFKLNTGNTLLRYESHSHKFIVTCFKRGIYLTKQQFKEKIGMTNKDTFTKDDLVAGKHVVECRNGYRYVLVDHDVLLSLGSAGWNTIDEFEENLTYKDNDSWDIMKVYGVIQKNLHTYEHLPLVWERTEKSEAQLQYEQCKAKMDELQKELAALEEKL